MKTNKNGVKLLATLMVFAMAFAAIVCVVDNEQTSSDADTIKTVEVNPSIATETDLVKKTLKDAISVEDVTNIVLKGNVVTGTETTGNGSPDYTMIAKKMTIDLNGYDITFKGYGFYVDKEGDLTITGNGTVTGGSYAVADYENLPLAAFGGNVTINGGTFVSKSCQECIFAYGESIITINGGTFKSDVPKDTAKGYLLNIGNSSSSQIIVNGGTFYDYDPSTGDDGNKSVTTFVPTGYYSEKSSESTDSTPIYKIFKSDASNSEASITNNNVTTYFNTLTEAVTNAATIEGEQSIVLLKDVTVKESLTITTDSIELNGHSISVSKAVTLKSTITNGEANEAAVDVIGGTKGAKISQGSIVLSGDYTTSGTDLITINSGEVKIFGTVENNVNIIVNAGAKLVIPEGKILDFGEKTVTINSGLDYKSTIAVYGTVKGEQTGSFTVDDNMTLAVSPNAEIPDNIGTSNIESVYAESGDRTGYRGTIDGNTPINGQAYLSDDLIVAEGVTFTINGDLSLNGHKLIVKGNLVISNKGTITGIGATDGKDTIYIEGRGSITNNGTIGRGNFPVSIASGDQTVTLQGVNGVQITTDKNANLLVSGNITKVSGAKTGDVSVNGAFLSDDVTVAKNVTLTVAGKSYVSKNGSVVINGILDATSGDLVLKEGSTISVNGKAFGIIKAEVDDEIPADAASTFDFTEFTTITLDNDTESATGYTVSVVRNQLTDDSGNVYFRQTAHIEGNINNTSSKSDADEVTIVVGGIIYIDEGKTITIGKNVGLTTDTGSYVIVNGTLANAPEDIGYIGASYTTTSTETATPVRYITSFDSALSVIDTVDQKTIALSGVDGYEIELNGNYAIKAGQTIGSEADTDALIIIGESGIVTVEEDGELDQKVIAKINGKLIVNDGASCSPDEFLYDVMSKDENENVTYAGFQVIISEAKSGDTITITGDNATVSSATIPEGVTVIVEGKLVVEKSLTVAEGGKLVIDGGNVTIGTAADAEKNNKAVPGTFKNYGTTDTTDGNLMMIGGSSDKKATIESTGDLITVAAYNFGSNYALNGAKYVNSDEDTIITTVSKAVEGSAAAGTNAVTVIGTVNDSADIVLGKVVLTIDANAQVTLGTIDVKEANIISNGLLTATIKGQFGTDGSTSDAIIKITKATMTSVTNNSKINAQNVKVWSLTFGKITGSIEFVTGTVVSGNIAAPETSVIEKATLKVDSDATLSIASDFDAIAGFDKVTIDGTVIITKDGGIDIDKATINGKLSVEGNATIGKLVLRGTLEVVDNETVTGTASVTGSIVLGGNDTTGTDAIINGTVSLGTDAYALAYPGSTISASNFGTASSVKSTVFYIGGVEYATAYATSTILAIGTSGSDKGFMNDVKIDGYYTTGIDDAAKWCTDIELKNNYGSSTFNVGDKSALYFKTTPVDVLIKVSVGTGISLYVDDLKVDADKNFTVGTHNVKAIVDPGFKGDVTITFNGKTVTDGKIQITSDMIDAGIVLNVTGDISVDSGNASASSDKNDGMSITDILLIVLVVLIVIMAVLVAIRMMRS